MRHHTIPAYVPIAVLIFCAGRLVPGRLQAAKPVLHVRVYDYAKVSPNELRDTEAEAERVLRLAGIQVEWNNCGSVGGCGANHDVMFRVVSQAPKAFARVVLGFSLPSYEGGLATLFYWRAVAIRSYGSFVNEILGKAMAHEIAHLLLGHGSHSPVGTTRPGHFIDEWGHAAVNQWFFTSAEAGLMRADVRRRSEERSSTPGSARW